MTKKIYTRITGTGSYIPTRVIENNHFLDYTFFDPSTKKPFEKENKEMIRKFFEITNISERRWVEAGQLNSDIAAMAARDSLESSAVDPESLDFIISCHNFGDVAAEKGRIDTMPSIANRVKKLLHIKNPGCICHDLIAGCPGWTQGMMVADAYLSSGMFRRGLVIGSDTLSRVLDPYDRDAMIFSDGAGATLVEAVESDEPVGILSHSSRSDSDPYMNLLTLEKSENPSLGPDEKRIKMAGHKVYVYALRHVPGVVKDSIEKAGLQLGDVKKILIHQANEKMDEAILKGLFKLYGEKHIPEGLMPMSIDRLGNSSTATVPTLLDLIVKGKMEKQEIREGDHLVMCSVGAGMNISSFVYRW